ncbi:MAG: putative transrane protein [Myxococcaceae bacterium]|nr:putative transrane protein [Myxococcaceae bacterium]
MRTATLLTLLSLGSVTLAHADGGAAKKRATGATHGHDASVAHAPDAGPGASAVDLAGVLAQFAKIEALSAKFHEEKHMALLSQPLSSDGTLHYAKPRLLARHTAPPHASSVLLRGETLSFGDDKHQESIELSAPPALRVLVDTFVSVLSGDLAALSRAAELSVESMAGGAFRIRVRPLDDKVKRLVRSMSFEGKGALLSRMELLDANGDTTVTTFSEVTLHKPYSAAEQARIFRIGH